MNAVTGEGFVGGILYVCVMFEQKIDKFIREKKLFGTSDRVLVALSGGADSVALLRVLIRLGYRCEAAHCNFHLRGEESARDEAFVVSLAERLGVQLHKTDFDTESHASANGISVEMAARELRYAWFEHLLDATGAKVVAVAHHRNDSVETFLLNLVRGTGIDGLLGIRAVNGRVVRPLLCTGRQEILAYLEELGQDYVTDSTNLQDGFTRNKLRLHVIPVLETINPSVVETVARTMARLEDVAEIYHAAVAEGVKRIMPGACEVDSGALFREKSPRAVLYEALRPTGVNASQVEDVFRCLEEGGSGRVFRTASHVLLTDHGRLRWKPAGEEKPLPVLCSRLMEVDGTFIVPKDAATAYIDADKVSGSLTLRKWKPGDRFVPFGMKGFKSVRNYLRDRKKSLFDKENQWVACAGDEIVWLAGERTDNRFRVTPQTRKVLKLWVEKG